MIRRLELEHFKGFARYTVHLRGDALLAGPNNAGKSTVIAALRTAARMLRWAERRRATENYVDKGRRVLGHPFILGQFGLIEENLRHEFRDLETRLSLTFNNGAAITAVWPPDPDEITPFFYVHENEYSIHAPQDVRRVSPTIGIVPVITPLEHEEQILSDAYVRSNRDGRLTSRHFRNQLYLLSREESEEFESLLRFCRRWADEIDLGRPLLRFGDGGGYLDVFFREPDSRIEKELYWAGDGLQIFVQLLTHLHRLRDHDVIILDEPDVFLHPDLQRRLVRILEETAAQTITATHSPELLAEAAPESVVWVDKVRRRAIRAPDTHVLTELVGSIGSQFNIRLARALRAQTVLFVEGEDMKLIRHVAAAAGAERVAAETGLAVVPLRGYSNWDRVEPFGWMIRDLLQDSVDVHMLLDRDYRTPEQVERARDRLREVGVDLHVWRRKELESYLLDAPLVSRVAGIDGRMARLWTDEFTEPMLVFVLQRRMVEERQCENPRTQREVRNELQQLWRDPIRRAWSCPPKQLLTHLNKRLEGEHLKALTFQRLARSMRHDDVPDEMTTVLTRIDRLRADRAIQ